MDICDKKISENEFEKTLQESDSEFDSDLENVVGKPKDTVHKKEKLSKSISDKSIRDSECSDNDESSIDFNEEENYSNTDDNDDNDDDDDYDDYESNLNSTADELDEDNSSEKSYKEKQYDTVNKAEKFAKRNKKHNSEFSENEKVQPKSKKVKFEEMVDDSSPSAHSEEDTALDDTQCTNIKSAEQNQMWEDIYGRMRDKTGNVIQTYVPPQKRKLLENSDNSKNEKLGKLRKQLKGLLNRLAESNMVYISNQVNLSLLKYFLIY